MRKTQKKSNIILSLGNFLRLVNGSDIVHKNWKVSGVKDLTDPAANISDALSSLISIYKAFIVDYAPEKITDEVIQKVYRLLNKVPMRDIQMFAPFPGDNFFDGSNEIIVALNIAICFYVLHSANHPDRAGNEIHNIFRILYREKFLEICRERARFIPKMWISVVLETFISDKTYAMLHSILELVGNIPVTVTLTQSYQLSHFDRLVEIIRPDLSDVYASAKPNLISSENTRSVPSSDKSDRWDFSEMRKPTVLSDAEIYASLGPKITIPDQKIIAFPGVDSSSTSATPKVIRGNIIIIGEKVYADALASTNSLVRLTTILQIQNVKPNISEINGIHPLSDFCLFANDFASQIYAPQYGVVSVEPAFPKLTKQQVAAVVLDAMNYNYMDVFHKLYLADMSWLSEIPDDKLQLTVCSLLTYYGVYLAPAFREIDTIKIQPHIDYVVRTTRELTLHTAYSDYLDPYFSMPKTAYNELRFNVDIDTKMSDKLLEKIGADYDNNPPKCIETIYRKYFEPGHASAQQLQRPAEEITGSKQVEYEIERLSKIRDDEMMEARPMVSGEIVKVECMENYINVTEDVEFLGDVNLHDLLPRDQYIEIDDNNIGDILDSFTDI